MAAAQGHGFQWWNLLHNSFLDANPHVAAAGVAAGGLVLASVAYAVVAPRVTTRTADDQAFVPPKDLGIRNLFDLAGEFVQGLAKDIIGHRYAEFLPILLFIFIWTLVNNLLGMIPGFGSSTDNLNTTLAMGFAVFLYYNILGFRTHGSKYLEHFTGHLHGSLLLFLGPIMFVIELISHSVRPLTLGIRLRSNIYGDHTIFGIVSGLFHGLGDFLTVKLGAFGAVIGGIISSLGPVPIVILGLLVSVIQAFVFTLLTTIYIGLATAHDEH